MLTSLASLLLSTLWQHLPSGIPDGKRGVRRNANQAARNGAIKGFAVVGTPEVMFLCMTLYGPTDNHRGDPVAAVIKCSQNNPMLFSHGHGSIQSFSLGHYGEAEGQENPSSPNHFDFAASTTVVNECSAVLR